MGVAFNLDRPRVVLLAVLAGLAALPAQAAGVVSSYVLMGEDGARVARVLTEAEHCPSITIDERAAPMRLRAPAETIPLRPTRSDPKDSKPSAFPLLTCEATVSAKARSARVAGRELPLPPARITRIVLIGDTGCRVKKSDNAYQACNDPKAYPFARVAASAAAWKPQLVIHVGDYLYRENACQDGHPGCAGSPWGYGADAWRADFFTPADPLLRAAAWAVVRGNHENCNRAGQGWWRFLDPRPLVPGRDCDKAADDGVGDYSDPYGVPLGGGYQLIVTDSSNASYGPPAAGDVRIARYHDAYDKMAVLAARFPHNIETQHHPVLGFAAHLDKAGQPQLDPGNGGLQSVWGPLSPTYFPAKVDVLLAGHIHLWEMVNFSSPHPAQFIAGFSGTQEDIVPLPAAPPDGATPAPGAVVQAMSSWIDGFGFMTLERVGETRWLAKVRDVGGVVVNTCEIKGSNAACTLAQVPHH
jgi:hypothetical protein